MAVITRAELTCPNCGTAQSAEMPTDACQFFHECVHCHSVLRPQPGDCCVSCSYADVNCPSKQAAVIAHSIIQEIGAIH